MSPAWARSISSARMSRPMWRSASSSRWWSWRFVRGAPLDEVRQKRLRRRRQQLQRQHAGHQRQAHEVPRAPDLRHPRGHRRLRLFPGTSAPLAVARQRRGDERHRGLHHRRHDAHRRRRQHHRHIFRRSVAQHDQKYRFFPRFGRSMVDKYHGSWYDMLVPCNSKSGPFPQK